MTLAALSLAAYGGVLAWACYTLAYQAPHATTGRPSGELSRHPP